jgi:hypothetical protein
MAYVLLVVAALLVSVLPASAQTTKFQENCTVSTDTNLLSKTPNIGSSWSSFDDTTAGAFALCDQTSVPANDDTIFFSAGTESARLVLKANPSSALTNADYYVEFTHVANPGGADDFAFVFLRATNNTNYYGFGWYREAEVNDCYIFEHHAVRHQERRGDWPERLRRHADGSRVGRDWHGQRPCCHR